MMMQGLFGGLAPAGEPKVLLSLPAGAKPKAVRLLTADRAVEVRVESGWLLAAVPSVQVHEVVGIDA